MLQLLGYLPQLLLIQSILHHLPFEYLRLSASSSQYFSFCLDRSLLLPKDKHSTSISSLQAASAGLAISQVVKYYGSTQCKRPTSFGNNLPKTTAECGSSSFFASIISI